MNEGKKETRYARCKFCGRKYDPEYVDHFRGGKERTEWRKLHEVPFCYQCEKGLSRNIEGIILGMKFEGMFGSEKELRMSIGNLQEITDKILVEIGYKVNMEKARGDE